jgi:hypothetical protein
VPLAEALDARPLLDGAPPAAALLVEAALPPPLATALLVEVDALVAAGEPPHAAGPSTSGEIAARHDARGAEPW